MVDPEQRHPDIQQWAQQLQQLAEATGLSLRQLAGHVPWSPSTLSRYLNGERVVEEAWLLASKLVELAEQRGATVRVQTDELHFRYKQARQAYQEQQRAQRVKPPEPPPTRRRALLVLSAVLGAVAVVGTIGFTVLWAQPEPRIWRAKIVGTWSEQYHQHLGVFRFRTPDIPGDTDKATYHEGTVVTITCQARHRREVSDPTTGQRSAVWNRLSDGYWIPDLYTDLPKVPGEDPPLDLPTC
ncbi:helix-turn-helix transcriptional regulator [Saccharopolyspora taberi]|uniref:HTH cro/C1-type domain-containing protein n=1 Tax=Saccharopolyspora taberi TaxID=60895 RepID=A0ABN3V8N6_9PSEU